MRAPTPSSAILFLWECVCSSPGLLFAIAFGLYAVFWGFRALYYVTLHPLARYPGPRFASISTWWIYRLSKTHRIEQRLEQLHKQYGTKVLRIAPNEVHIDDPSLYNEIYSQKNVYKKDPYFYAGFNAPNTAFSEHDIGPHRERRKLMSPSFSKQTIAKMQDVLRRKIGRACRQLSKVKNDGAVHVHNFLRCMTVDVISELAFGQSLDLLDSVQDNTFQQPILEALDFVVENVVDFHYWPLYRAAANMSPGFITRVLAPKTLKFYFAVQAIQKALDDYLMSKDIMDQKRRDATIFKPLEHLTKEQLINESIDIIIAGSDTTATTLSFAIHEILKNPAIARKLTAELDAAMPESARDLSLAEAEKLSYLSAVVKESLRLAKPVPGRLPRIVPAANSKADPLIVDGRVIPKGTIVGMSAWSVHFNEDIWGPDAREFHPERWLVEDAKSLERYLVTFSKGARICLGINLAYAEIRLALAQLFRRFTFSVDETMKPIDTEMLDCFTTAFGGTGPRVFITGERL
ncbi:cytochrome P450 [Aspergillus floccosus]